MADIEVKTEDNIAVVVLNRAQRRNAMTLAMWRETARRFARLGEDPDVRAILLTGAGGNFCAGADIAEFSQVRDTAEQSAEYEVAVDECADAIMLVPKPTMAAVHGHCIGGGCHLAMACDFRFAAPAANFAIPAARLSIVYGVRATQKLLALVGLTQAKRILYSAESFDAAEALRIGFIERVSDDPLAAAQEFAAVMARNAPLSIAGAKALLTGLAMGHGALDGAEAQRLIHAAAASEDYREGRRAFLEKRRAVFKGR